MKKLYCSMLLLFALSATVKAQVCKILISYNDNGSRVKREKSCVGMRPGDTTNNNPLVSDNSDSLQHLTDISPQGVFEIYPNPTGSLVNIRLDEVSLSSKCNITITDVTGRPLYNKIINSALTPVSLGGYADGTYIFILQRGTEINTVRVIKATGAIAD